MDLHGLLYDVEFGRDLFVHSPDCHKAEDLDLAVGQSPKAFFQLTLLGPLGADVSAEVDGPFDGWPELLSTEGLAEEIHRAGSHGLNAHGDAPLA